ncbi:MAG: MurR/RpiR family transcriptional regulator [Hyphomicrobiaceae bacterium]|nr:MurR/RpiR family transcriptional regulator [Hyphomicrobiaceae bacterium]
MSSRIDNHPSRLASDQGQDRVMTATLSTPSATDRQDSPRESVETSTPATGFLEDLRQKGERLGPAQRKVLDFILAQPSRAPDMPISEIAAGAGVSEPTVARFAQELGLKGYREFRIKLARAMSGNVSFMPSGVELSDQPKDIAAKVIDHSIQALLAVRAGLDGAAIARAVDILDRARRIEIYGQGSSGIVAQDAQHKLIRLGTPVVAYSDPHIHAVAAALLGPDDAVIVISRSGKSRELVATLAVLAEFAVPVIAVAPLGTPISRGASVTIHIDFDEDPDLTMPMSSRLGQLAVLDILAVALAVRRGGGDQCRIGRGKAATAEKRL